MFGAHAWSAVGGGWTHEVVAWADFANFLVELGVCKEGQ